jgi:hypothetical protein
MPPERLFAKYDIYNVIESLRSQMLNEYKGLPDADALNEVVIKALKEKYWLNVPVLRTDIWAEEGTAQVDARRLPNRIFFDDDEPIMEEVPEYLVHIPFDGDAQIFDVAPSAYNSRIAVGEIVGREVVIGVRSIMPGFNVQGEIDNQIGQIKWALEALREKKAYLDQQLEGGIRQAVQARRQAIEYRERSKATLSIPIKKKQFPTTSPANVPPPARTKAATAQNLKVLKQYDAFISHAWEDREYSEQLAAGLGSAGIEVWLDTLVLNWGDSLRQNIDNGLKKSRFVIIILSKTFLAKKKWTEYELTSAFALETVNEKRILPIWHGITYEDLKEYSPALTDRLARESDKHSVSEIANELLIVLGRRPDHAVPIESKLVEPPPIPTSAAAQGDLVAYVWYWTKDGKLAGLYVRKAGDREGIFLLEEPNGTVHEGNAEEIATRYLETDRSLRSEGLRRATVMGSSEYPQFNPQAR